MTLRKKRRGPRTEPWGTPVVRAYGTDADPVHAVTVLLESGKDKDFVRGPDRY